MKWLNIPVDDDVHRTLRILSDATGSSPEEIIMRIVTGAVRGYTQLVAQGREEELKQLLLNPATQEAMKQSMKEKLPDSSGLWLP